VAGFHGGSLPGAGREPSPYMDPVPAAGRRTIPSAKPASPTGRRSRPRRGAGGKSPDFSRLLLDWYDREARLLPWRVPPAERKRGLRPDPYRVWLSEVMLQQTRVTTVIPYWRRFTERWPTVEALAAASAEDVTANWAGLGYYARARNLHACAKLVAARHDGRFPDSEAGLLALPGIGPYTAAAIAAIAFDHPTLPVDGNIERVMARFHCVEEPLPNARPRLRALARSLSTTPRPGDLAQALMDLGATLCIPRAPRCEDCPVRQLCPSAANGLANKLPRRAPKTARPTRHGVVFVASRSDGAVWVERRAAAGLLGGMLGFPGTDWSDGRPSAAQAAAAAPFAGDWAQASGEVEHGFTHFRLRLRIRLLQADGLAPRAAGQWQHDPLALPSVMRKALDHARSECSRAFPTSKVLSSSGPGSGGSPDGSPIDAPWRPSPAIAEPAQSRPGACK